MEPATPPVRLGSTAGDTGGAKGAAGSSSTGSHFSPDCVCITGVLRCYAHPSTTKWMEIQTFQGNIKHGSPLFDMIMAVLIARRAACVCCRSAEPHWKGPNVQTLHPGEKNIYFFTPLLSLARCLMICARDALRLLNPPQDFKIRPDKHAATWLRLQPKWPLIKIVCLNPQLPSLPA